MGSSVVDFVIGDAVILPSLQVNIRGGAMPQPTSSGRVFLKIPVTGP
jgi:hypothetical protein